MPRKLNVGDRQRVFLRRYLLFSLNGGLGGLGCVFGLGWVCGKRGLFGFWVTVAIGTVDTRR